MQKNQNQKQILAVTKYKKLPNELVADIFRAVNTWPYDEQQTQTISTGNLVISSFSDMGSYKILNDI